MTSWYWNGEGNIEDFIYKKEREYEQGLKWAGIPQSEIPQSNEKGNENARINSEK